MKRLCFVLVLCSTLVGCGDEIYHVVSPAPADSCHADSSHVERHHKHRHHWRGR